MFNKTRILELEIQVGDLSRKIEQINEEKSKLDRDLQSARHTVADLEARVAAFDPAAEKKQVDTDIAQYEGLKAMYEEKLRYFDEELPRRNEILDQEDADKRANLAQDIQDARQANEDEMAATIQDFSDTYNSYLHQLKRLMTSLGDVTAQTGQALFSSSNEDLKGTLGHRMADRLTEISRQERAALAEAAEKAEQEAKAAEEAEEEKAAARAEKKTAKKAVKKAAKKSPVKKAAGKKSHAATPVPEGPAQDHLGNQYPSHADMLAAYHVVPRTFNYRKNLGWTLQECLEGRAK